MRVLLVKELRALARDGRLVVLLLMWSLLLAGTAWVSSLQQRQDAIERERVSQAVRAQWDLQGDKHPHRGAHFGLYALRPFNALAAFEPGVQRAIGQALYLEPHRRNVAHFSPQADQPASARLVQLSPAFLLQWLMPLLVYALAFQAVTAERESGNLRLLQASGVSPLAWLAAKVVSVAGVVGVMALPSLVPVLSIGWGAPDASLLARTGGLAVSLLLSMVLHSALAVLVSAWSSSSRVALLVLLAWWVTSTLVLPRVGAEAAERLRPLPTADAFWSAIGREVREGIPGEPSLAVQLQAFERQTLAAHGVDRAEDLPVGWLALRRLFRDAHADRVHDRHFDGLWQRYEAQQRLALAASLASPAVAWRSVAMTLSGTDLKHERHFQTEAERHRRDVNTRIDRWDVEHSRGLTSYEQRYAGEALWRAMPTFAPAAVPAGRLWRDAAPETGVLLGWLVASCLGLVLAARTLKP
jgi:ABC-2 type transport system permease protein